MPSAESGATFELPPKSEGVDRCTTPSHLVKWHALPLGPNHPPPLKPDMAPGAHEVRIICTHKSRECVIRKIGLATANSHSFTITMPVIDKEVLHCEVRRILHNQPGADDPCSASQPYPDLRNPSRSRGHSIPQHNHDNSVYRGNWPNRPRTDRAKRLDKSSDEGAGTCLPRKCGQLGCWFVERGVKVWGRLHAWIIREAGQGI